ncbi:riboflavin kinase, partial [Amycolatopsis sp. NPDC051114]|uniref:riboflavin kinase n=1 Tax=Amycolatopsis sp. NPDC051114 TaxID=3155280 RepID=UPI00342BF248
PRGHPTFVGEFAHGHPGRGRPGVRGGGGAGPPRADGSRVPAAISVGRRPTYYGADGYRLLEAHLLDFTGDLYGETLVVWLGSHLRDQQAYASAEDLITALKTDIAAATQWTAAHPAAGLPPAGESPLGEVRRIKG